MKKIFSILIIVALMSLASCATQTFQINPGTAGEPTTDEMALFFVYGIGQETTVDASAICGGSDKIVKVEATQTFVDVLIGAFTGIINPRHAKVYCK